METSVPDTMFEAPIITGYKLMDINASPIGVVGNPNVKTEMSGGGILYRMVVYPIAATRLLFGDSSHVVQEVINAWYAVGVLNTLSVQENKNQISPDCITIYPNPYKRRTVPTINKELEELTICFV